MPILVRCTKQVENCKGLAGDVNSKALDDKLAGIAILDDTEKSFLGLGGSEKILLPLENNVCLCVGRLNESARLLYAVCTTKGGQTIFFALEALLHHEYEAVLKPDRRQASKARYTQFIRDKITEIEAEEEARNEVAQLFARPASLSIAGELFKPICTGNKI